MDDTKVTLVDDPSLDFLDESAGRRLEETDFGKLAERAVSRRAFLKDSLAFGASAFVVATTKEESSSTSS